MGYEFLRGALGEKEARPRFLLARLLSSQRAEPSEQVEAHSAICWAPKGAPRVPMVQALPLLLKHQLKSEETRLRATNCLVTTCRGVRLLFSHGCLAIFVLGALRPQ